MLAAMRPCATATVAASCDCQAELGAEDRRYRDYLHQVRDDERRRERELESPLCRLRCGLVLPLL